MEIVWSFLSSLITLIVPLIALSLLFDFIRVILFKD